MSGRRESRPLAQRWSTRSTSSTAKVAPSTSRLAAPRSRRRCSPPVSPCSRIVSRRQPLEHRSHTAQRWRRCPQVRLDADDDASSTDALRRADVFNVRRDLDDHPAPARGHVRDHCSRHGATRRLRAERDDDVERSEPLLSVGQHSGPTSQDHRVALVMPNRDHWSRQQRPPHRRRSRSEATTQTGDPFAASAVTTATSPSPSPATSATLPARSG